MSYHNHYSIPPPSVSSNRWNRLVSRSIPTRDRLKVQLTAVAFIFLLITGPVYWIHPPRFDLRQRRIAGLTDIKPGLPHLRAQHRGVGPVQVASPEKIMGRSSLDHPSPSVEVLKLVLRLPGSAASEQSKVRSDAAKAQKALNQLSDILHPSTPGMRRAKDSEYKHFHKVDVTSRIFAVADSSATEKTSFDTLAGVDMVKTSCLLGVQAPLCCELVGEFDYLLSLFRSELQKLSRRSLVCVYHPEQLVDEAAAPGAIPALSRLRQRAGRQCGADQGMLPSLSAMLAMDTPLAKLQSTRPTVVGHAHCGPLIVHQLGYEDKEFEPRTRHAAYSYCLNGAMLDVLNQKAQRASHAGASLQMICKFLPRMGLDGDAPQRLGPLRFALKMLKMMGA